MKALGSYIFAGGFTLGVSKHFDVEAHFEMKPGLYNLFFVILLVLPGLI